MYRTVHVIFLKLTFLNLIAQYSAFSASILIGTVMPNTQNFSFYLLIYLLIFFAYFPVNNSVFPPVSAIHNCGNASISYKKLHKYDLKTHMIFGQFCLGCYILNYFDKNCNYFCSCESSSRSPPAPSFVCSSVRLFVCTKDVFSMQLCDIATLQLCNIANLYICNIPTLQLCSIATLQLCNFAILHHCHISTLQICNFANL